MQDQQRRINIGSNYYLYESNRIGLGSFGTIYLGENKLTRQMVAIKKMDLELMKVKGVDIETVKEEAKI